jgi:predicted RNA-binding Zn-ribbon protein involved in translation (DUF1610 family)
VKKRVYEFLEKAKEGYTVGFLASGFEEGIRNRNRKKKITCPKCGEEIKLE